MANTRLFLYGTLQDRDVLSAVLGISGEPLSPVPAAAPGYRVVHYPGRIYPALLPASHATASGLLLDRLLPHHLALLDAFEGDEYRRAPLDITTLDGPQTAQAYFPTRTIPADAPLWSLAHWRRAHKAAMIATEPALVALRPAPRADP